MLDPTNETSTPAATSPKPIEKPPTPEPIKIDRRDHLLNKFKNHIYKLSSKEVSLKSDYRKWVFSRYPIAKSKFSSEASLNNFGQLGKIDFDESIKDTERHSRFCPRVGNINHSYCQGKLTKHLCRFAFRRKGKSKYHEVEKNVVVSSHCKESKYPTEEEAVTLGNVKIDNGWKRRKVDEGDKYMKDLNKWFEKSQPKEFKKSLNLGQR